MEEKPGMYQVNTDSRSLYVEANLTPPNRFCLVSARQPSSLEKAPAWHCGQRPQIESLSGCSVVAESLSSFSLGLFCHLCNVGNRATLASVRMNHGKGMWLAEAKEPIDSFSFCHGFI